MLAAVYLTVYFLHVESTEGLLIYFLSAEVSSFHKVWENSSLQTNDSSMFSFDGCWQTSHFLIYKHLWLQHQQSQERDEAKAPD